jgi:hypothetical protein
MWWTAPTTACSGLIFSRVRQASAPTHHVRQGFKRMTNEHKNLVSIGCDCGARIEIEFGPIERDFIYRDYVRACTRLFINERKYEGWNVHYGIDILQFADALADLYKQQVVSARFCDWDGLVILCLTAFDRMGHISIGGQLVPMELPHAYLEDEFLPRPRFSNTGGIQVAFEGLTTDQSYLPNAISGLRRFLAESEISVKAIWD